MAGNGKLPLHARFLALHAISPIRKARECDSEKHTYYMYARENVCNSVIAHTDYMCGNGTGANARGNVCNSAIAQRATRFPSERAGHERAALSAFFGNVSGFFCASSLCIESAELGCVSLPN